MKTLTLFAVVFLLSGCGDKVKPFYDMIESCQAGSTISWKYERSSWGSSISVECSRELTEELKKELLKEFKTTKQ